MQQMKKMKTIPPMRKMDKQRTRKPVNRDENEQHDHVAVFIILALISIGILAYIMFLAQASTNSGNNGNITVTWTQITDTTRITRIDEQVNHYINGSIQSVYAPYDNLSIYENKSCLLAMSLGYVNTGFLACQLLASNDTIAKAFNFTSMSLLCLANGTSKIFYGWNLTNANWSFLFAFKGTWYLIDNESMSYELVNEMITIILDLH